MGSAEGSGFVEAADLEKTDKLPVLDVAAYEASVGESSIVEPTSSLPSLAEEPVSRAERRQTQRPVVAGAGEVARAANVDLPSLTESVRSVEEKIARQNAQYEALKRDLERARAAEAAAEMRAGAAASELGTLRSLLDAERTRTQQLDKMLGELNAAARDADRIQGASATLRETVAAKEASLTQALRTLGEHDAQLALLQREHDSMQQSLAERASEAARLQASLQQSGADLDAARSELTQARASNSEFAEQASTARNLRQQSERELVSLRAQLAAHQEKLRSREYRRGSYESAVRALDEQLSVERRSTDGMRAELAAKEDEISRLLAQSIDREAVLAQLRGELSSSASHLTGKSDELEQLQGAVQQLRQRAEALERDKAQLAAALAAAESSARDLEYSKRELQGRVDTLQSAQASQSARVVELDKLAGETESRYRAATDQLRIRERAFEAAESERARLAEHTERLESELQAAHEIIEVTTHTAQSVEAEIELRERRVRDVQQNLAALETSHAEQSREFAEARAALAATQERLQAVQAPTLELETELAATRAALAEKTAEQARLEEENRGFKEQLERTKGALEEREFLIRRLEKSAANSAQALGRIQNSIERLGEPGDLETSLAMEQPYVALLTRLEGGADSAAILLGRRTRVGRSLDSDLRIDATSVSRHHALVISGPRYAIVEDLNSTNGIRINEKSMTRGKLKDGDVLTIGEVKFRFSLSQPAEAAAP